MDIKDPKLQKLALGVLVLAVAVLFWHSRFYTKLTKDVKQKESKYEAILTDLNQVKIKAKSLKGLQEEYQQLMRRYSNVEQLLPEENQVPKFLMQLHSASAMTDSRVKEIAPKGQRSEKFYNINDFELKFTGSFHEFGEFLSNAANFPFITNVSAISLTGLPPADLANSKDADANKTLDATFVLSTYYVKPEEKLVGLQP